MIYHDVSPMWSFSRDLYDAPDGMVSLIVRQTFFLDLTYFDGPADNFFYPKFARVESGILSAKGPTGLELFYTFVST